MRSSSRAGNRGDFGPEKTGVSATFLNGFASWLGSSVALLFCLLIATAVFASDVPPVSSIPNTGNFTAHYLKNHNHIAVIELSGDYDKDLSGQFNVEPRAVIAREFYRHHPDDYDFLVVFTSFDFESGDAVAFHHLVKNEVSGIGDRPLFDNALAYGSNGRLQGFIDMAALSRYATDPLDPEYDFMVQAFAHEFMHQWAAFVRFKDSDGRISNGLLGPDDAHWSFLLDSDASIMYGHRWRDNGDGTFTSVKARDNFSSLDLYLMGLLGPESVPSMTLLVAPEQDGKRMPELGVTIRATPKTVTIADIIAAEGPRLPAVADSQKDFRFAFIYVVRAGETAQLDSQLGVLGNLRREVGVRFNALTRGLATANIASEESSGQGPGTPEIVVRPGDEGGLDGSVSLGLAWLREHQQPSGAWGDSDATMARDTRYALHAIRELGSDMVGPLGRGLAWFQATELNTTDGRAYRMSALRASGLETPAETLLARQNSDGGWGFAEGYESNPFDTALAVRALLSTQAGQSAAVENGRAYLLSRQNDDGGWGNTATGASRVTATAQALLALAEEKGMAGVTAARAALFLASKQNGDGGFGDSPSSVHDTAQAVSALVATGATEMVRIDAAVSYIAATQRSDGSWQGSAYATALALRAVSGTAAMNWMVESFTAEPERAPDGVPVTFQVRLRNSGGIRAPATLLRFHEGAPGAGSGSFDFAVPPLAPGARAEIAIPWQTFGRQGEHTLTVVVDPEQQHAELTRSDNSATLNYVVDAPRDGVDLLVSADDITLTPARPAQLPAALTIDALLTNAGTQSASQVKVVLWEGRSGEPSGKRAGERIVDLPARVRTPVSFDVTLAQSGETLYTIEIDPDGVVSETNRDNNRASVTVTPQARLDVAVAADDVSVSLEQIRLDDDVTFRVRLHNRGTVDSPTFRVRYRLSGPHGVQELRSNNVQIAAGQSVEQTLDWRSSVEGALTFHVELDPDGRLDESDLGNNQTEFAFNVGQRFDGANLAVSYKDIHFTPEPGIENAPLTISALIRNTGAGAAQAFEVAFYHGDPDSGGVEIAPRQTVNALAAGGSQVVDGQVARLGLVGRQLFYIIVDPQQQINELNREDNRAFAMLDIQGLPDLAVGNADISLQPSVPRPGDAVRISAVIANLGHQSAEQVMVRLYDGEPGGGGNAVGEQTIASLAPTSSATVAFDYVIPVNGGRPLYLLVDPEQRISERSRDNNQAVIELNAQNLDFMVSERYFSPNGDGVKDATELSFRLSVPMNAFIDVMREDNGRVVRTHRAAELAGAQSGRWRWDGRDDDGVIVKDGRYLLRVANDAGEVQGSALTAVDNNRSSILDAVGTDLGYRVMLSDKESRRTVVAANGDAWYTFERDSHDDSWGIVRIDGRSGQKSRVIRWKDEHAPLMAVNQDGRAFAFVKEESQLMIADQYGKNSRALADFQEEILEVMFASDPQTIFVLTKGPRWDSERTLWRVSLQGEKRALYLGRNLGLPGSFSYQNEPDYLYRGISPDGRLLVSSGDEEKLTLIDLDSGIVKPLPLPTSTDASRSFHILWSPDSRYLLVNENSYGQEDIITVFDRGGNMAQTYIQVASSGKISGVAWIEPYDRVLLVETALACRNGMCGDQQDGVEVKILDVATGQVGSVYRQEDAGFSSADWFGNYVFQPLAENCSGYPSGVSGGEALNCHIQAGGRWWGHPSEWITVRNDFVTADLLDHTLLFDGQRIGLLAPYPTEALTFAQPEPFAPQGRLSGIVAEQAGAIYYVNPDRQEEEIWAYRSPQNLDADLKALRLAGGTSYKLYGTAADRHFFRYSLEYAVDEETPRWQLLAPAADAQVVRGVLGIWVPPGIGKYLLRLTVEDLAGNRRQVETQVNYTGLPAITDLLSEPEYISPNGDDVQDRLDIRYRVLEPVNFEIEIYDNDDVLVRSLLREHPEADVDSQLFWDGRDEQGQVVADGRYRVVALDYEFSVVVDNTPPAALPIAPPAAGPYRPGITLSDPFGGNGGDPRQGTRYCTNIGFFSLAATVCSLAQLDWAVEEANKHSIRIEARDKRVAGSEWYDYFPDEEHWDTRALLERFPLIDSLDDYVNKVFRVVAEDKAGNRLVVETQGTEKTEVFEIGPVIEKSAGSAVTWQSLTSNVLVYGDDGKAAELYAFDNGFFFNLRTTVAAPLTGIAIEYRKWGDAAWIKEGIRDFLIAPAGNFSEKRWTVSPLLPADAHDYHLLWHAPLKAETVYEYRFRLDSVDGETHFSPVRSFRIAGLTYRIEIPYGNVGTDAIPYETVYRQLPLRSQVEIFLSSEDDIRFLTPRRINAFETDSMTEQRHAFLYSPLPEQLRPCRRYKLEMRVRVHDAAGQEIELPSRSVYGSFCDDIAIRLRSQPSGCNDPGVNPISVELGLSGNVGAPLLNHLVFGRQHADGSDDIFFNVVHPQIGTVYRTELDPEVLQRGENDWFARTVDAEGKTTTQWISLNGDFSPPQVRITYPAEGQKMCARMLPDSKDILRPGIEIEAEVHADGWGYGASASKGSLAEQWRKPPDRSSLSLCMTTSDRLKCSPPESPIESAPDPLFAYLFEPNGETTVSLSVANWAGIQTCTQNTFIVDGEVEAAMPILSAAVFSPLRETVDILQSAGEPVKVDLAVYAGEAYEETQDAEAVWSTATQVRTPGDFYLSWDGRDSRGNVVADGIYSIVIDYRDDCDLTATHTLTVEVDTTPPALSILTPRSGGNQPMVIDVSGSVEDRNLTHWRLEYGVGSDPSHWMLIAESGRDPDQPLRKIREIIADWIAEWNTYGLPNDDYTLQIWAVDLAGNEAEMRVSILIERGDWLLSYFEAQPSLFSPNGDGKFDQSAIRFGLEANALILLEIGGNGIAPRRLINGTALTAGNHEWVWDGRDSAGEKVPDGRYRAEIQAQGIEDETLRQTEAVTVTVDNSPPRLTIVSPSSGVIKGASAVSVSVEDAHPGEYQLKVRGVGGEQVFAEGEGGLAGEHQGDLSGFAEGPYTLLLSAVDQVGNAAALEHEINIDNTPPAITLSAPQAEGFYGGPALPLAVAIVEKHPLRWAVSLGQGPPENATILAQGTTELPAPGSLTWRPGEFADGAYRLRVTAEDAAGWQSTQEIALDIDNTPPLALLTTPVAASGEITGTASDANLARYQLEIAPGTGDAAQRWTLLAESGEAITDDVLGALPALDAGAYTLRLTVLDKAGNQSQATEEIRISAPPPEDVIQLSAAIENDDQVRLHWNASIDPAIVGYHVEQDGRQLTAAPIGALTYLVEQPGTGELTFIVYAVYGGGREHASNPARITLNPGNLQAFISAPQPQGKVSGTVEIRGSAFSASGFKEYRLSLGEGAAPAAYELLRQSPLSVQNDVLGLWHTRGLAEGATYTLLLQAEDIRGNRKQASVTVEIDNLPPARPTGLRADAVISDVTLTWNPNTETDLDGYLLYRDGQRLNCDDNAPAAACMIRDTTYLDRNVPDGDYRYTLEAIDTAGNRSEPSAPAAISLDNRAPSARIIQPPDNSRVDRDTYLLAASEDNDVAQVQYEWRARDEALWQPLGAALTREPYGIHWNPQGLAHGLYQFRAVATDRSGNTDADPPSIQLHYTDQLERVLRARVDGGDITLDWTASEAERLQRYVLYRDDEYGYPQWIAEETIGATTHIDAGLEDGQYTYRLHSVDDRDVDVEAALSATATVHTPQLRQPFTPIATRETTLSGEGLTPNRAQITLSNSAGSDVVANVALDQEGRFASGALALETGDNRLYVLLHDDQGNRSRTVETHVMTGDRPAAPAGVTGSASAADVTLDWSANAETDLWGYLIGVDGALLDHPWSGGATASVSNGWGGEYAIDGDPDTYWSLYFDRRNPFEESWFHYQLDAQAQILAVDLRWQQEYSGVLPQNFDLEAWDGEVWVPLAEIRHNGQAAHHLDLGEGYRTDQLRLRFYEQPLQGGYQEIQLAQFSLRHAPVITGTHWQGGLANGRHDVAVHAVSELGLVGGASTAVALEVEGAEIGAPQALAVTVPPLSNALDLQWQAPAEPDPAAVAYRIYRSTNAGADYRHIHTVPANLTDYRDNGLAGGVRYYYAVRSEDALGNVSGASNEASGVPTSAFDAAGIDAPYLMYPAQPGLPATVAGTMATVFGIAQPGVTVRLDGGRDNGRRVVAAVAASEVALPVTSRQRAVWSPDGSLALAWQQNGFTLYQLDGTQARQLRDESHGPLDGVPAISPDNRHIALVEQGRLRLYRIADGQWLDMALPAAANASGELAWSRDGRLAVVGLDASRRGVLYLLDAALRQFEPLRQNGDEQQLAGLAWSPDGKHLAFHLQQQFDYELLLLSLEDRSETSIDYAYNMLFRLSWRGDGQALYYAADNYTNLKRYHLNDGSTEDYSVYPNGNLTASPYQDILVSGGDMQREVYLYAPASDETQLFAALPAGVRDLHWQPSGYLTYSYKDGNQWRHVRHSPAGHLRYDAFALNGGENRLTAQSEPTAGEGRTSEEVIIYAAADALPDLAVTETDITVMPGVPNLGETTKVTVRIRNIGGADAPTSEVAIHLGAPGGVTTLYDGPLAALRAGEATSLSFDWTPAAAGRHEIAVSIDAAGRLSELDESNNVASRAINVLRSDVSVGLELLLARDLYDQGETVSGNFTVTNGGALLNGTLEIVIEDVVGYEVTRLAPVAISNLASGRQQSLPLLWSSGATLPGDYRVSGSLHNLAGDALAGAQAPFTIRAPALSASASLISDRERYSQGDSVALYGGIEFTGFTATHAAVPALIRILDGSGSEVHRDARNLNPVNRVDLNSGWTSSANDAVGLYRAILTVGDEAAPLAQSETAFELAEPVAVTRYHGSLALAAAAVRIGASAHAEATLANTGTVAISQLPVLLSVTDPQTGMLLAQQRQLIDLPLGASRQLSADFDTRGWPLRRHHVALQIEASAHTPDGNTHTLQQQPLSLFETDAPIVAITRPADGLLAQSVAAVYGSAYDLDSALTGVHYQLDGDQWQAMLLSNPLEHGYAASLPALADGGHTLVMRATDAFNNTGASAAVRFTLDTVAPQIDIINVADGQNYDGSVTPQITVSDLHLDDDSVTITLDGIPYVSGTSISATGSHSLIVVAADLAGNQAAATVTFTIRGGAPVDATAPIVTILEPRQNAYLQRAGLLRSLIVDADSGVKDAHYRLDGGNWTLLPAGGGNDHYQIALGSLSDGDYRLDVKAADNAGNESNPVSVAFIVDTLPPAIDIQGVAQDGRYDGGAAATITVSDLHLDAASVTITLDGAPYVSGAAIAVGSHILSVRAADLAGNRSEVALTFDVIAPDTTAPQLIIIKPLAGSYLNDAGNLEVQASDLESGVKTAHYRLDGGNWQPLNALRQNGRYQAALGGLADGPHRIDAKAEDNAGNESSPVSVAFTIDTLAPVIDIDNVADGHDYDEPALPLAPVIRITELNPQSERITLNGRPYVSGTPLPGKAANYTLQVEAIDKAGNRSVRTLRFTVLGGVSGQIHDIPTLGLNGWLLGWYLLLAAIAWRAVARRNKRTQGNAR